MTVTPLPQSYSWGKVVGRVVHAIADTPADTDAFPEARPATGKVTFTPAVLLQRTTEDDYTAFVVHEEVTAELDGSGTIVDSTGRPGIWLIEGGWTVKFAIAQGQIRPFPIEVTRDFTATEPLDLVKAAEYTPPPAATVVTALIPTGGMPGQVLTPDGPGSTTLEWADAGGAGGGAPGASAYEVAVDNGFVGTEAEWLSSLNGDPGPQGDPGPPGAASTVPGPKGDKGDKGDPGNDLTHSTPQLINAQTGTAYTLQASDAGKLVTLTNAAAITVTVPAGVFTAGQRVDLAVLGAGMATLVGSGGMTLHPTDTLVTRKTNSVVSVLALTATSALVVGSLA